MDFYIKTKVSMKLKSYWLDGVYATILLTLEKYSKSLVIERSQVRIPMDETFFF